MKDFKQQKTGYYLSEQCKISDFQNIINQRLVEGSVPHANAIEKNIHIYDIEGLQNSFKSEASKYEFMADWARVGREREGAKVRRREYLG